MQARCTVLGLLDTYLRVSPHAQRLAVREWHVVAALFGLLWEPRMRSMAMNVVCIMSLASAA